MPKKTKRNTNKKILSRKIRRTKKIVSFASITSIGEPVIDHSKQQTNLFKDMEEIIL